jgi:hypothetical protein
MPVRFTSPSLGGQRNGIIEKGEWQIGLAYRRLTADEWYVGTQVDEAKAPFGRPLYLDINSLDLSVSYGVTERLSLTFTLPFSHGTHSRFYADTARHKVRAIGVGDVNLLVNYWLRDPRLQPVANLALAAGVKAPTGRNDAQDDFFLPNAPPTPRPVDQSIQPGDGAWGIMIQAQGYRALFERASLYFSGSYLVSPHDTTNIASPIPGTPVVHLAVPDVYLARAGVAYAVAPAAGMSASLGARVDGIPQRDIIGGRDAGFRRPGYSLYLDPGIAVSRGRNELALSVPIALHQDFQRSWIDRARDFAGGGDLADYLVFLSYTRRF